MSIIKKGNNVKILTGKDKNKNGEIIEIDRKNYRAKVPLRTSTSLLASKSDIITLPS